jgi:hypothetical protein
MRSRVTRITMWVALLGATGGVLAGSGLACASLNGRQALATFDSCFLFDCQNGAIGGLVDFCAESSEESSLFTDCPEFTTGDTGN